ncbi:MAG: polymer-forming cytoskeletal protein [Blastocatellia bacterium]|jgi:cytoskeletal protein CcmA (bactofilin family)|nr:polymer-forming cytoskeletal protein [Blastocatellia bacterium]MBK6426879.1 polymer-forming cytoskeletal protein [Blastocatellia bacterium]
MLLRKKNNGGGDGFGGILSEGTEIDGEVRFADELRVDGRITGKVQSERGRLLVGESGHVEAEVYVAIASISGTMSGTLVAATKVEIHATGRFYGNIHSPALIIEEGAVFEGNCEMATGSSHQYSSDGNGNGNGNGYGNGQGDERPKSNSVDPPPEIAEAATR